MSVNAEAMGASVGAGPGQFNAGPPTSLKIGENALIGVYTQLGFSVSGKLVE
jgi:hypothetical protein